MKTIEINYKGKVYVARKLELLYTEFKDSKYDDWMIAGDDLRNAIDEGFRNANGDFESDEYCDAENISAMIHLFLPNEVVDYTITDTELLWQVMKRDCMEKDIDDSDWFYLMRMATFQIALMYEKGLADVMCESYECGGRYSVYAYRNGANRNIYEGESAKSAAMAAMGFLTAISLQKVI